SWGSGSSARGAIPRPPSARSRRRRRSISPPAPSGSWSVGFRRSMRRRPPARATGASRSISRGSRTRSASTGSSGRHRPTGRRPRRLFGGDGENPGSARARSGNTCEGDETELSVKSGTATRRYERNGGLQSGGFDSPRLHLICPYPVTYHDLARRWTGSRNRRIGAPGRTGMPQRKSLVTVIRDMVREQVQEAVQGLLGTVGGGRREYRKSKNGRRRRRRGPGRPPGSKTRMRRGPGRPPKAEQAA